MQRWNEIHNKAIRTLRKTGLRGVANYKYEVMMLEEALKNSSRSEGVTISRRINTITKIVLEVYPETYFFQRRV